MKKGICFLVFRIEIKELIKKINLLHFPVFTSKNFVILKLPEPFTDFNHNTLFQGLSLHALDHIFDTAFAASLRVFFAIRETLKPFQDCTSNNQI